MLSSRGCATPRTHSRARGMTAQLIMPQFWKGSRASGFVPICIRSAISFECRTVMLFVGDRLLLAAGNGTETGLLVALGSQRLMDRSGIRARSQGIEYGFYPLDGIRTWACQNRVRIQCDHPEDKSDQGRGPQCPRVCSNLLHVSRFRISRSQAAGFHETRRRRPPTRSARLAAGSMLPWLALCNVDATDAHYCTSMTSPLRRSIQFCGKIKKRRLSQTPSHHASLKLK